MRKVDLLFLEYSESHQDSTNKVIHWICVPMIFCSIVGLLASIPSYPVQVLLGAANPLC
ncbi:MAG: Mpo1-like protein [Chryseolinea sp.]